MEQGRWASRGGSAGRGIGASWGLPEVLGGMLAGVLLSAVVAGMVFAAGGWAPDEATGDGAAVGRTSMQVASGGDVGSEALPLTVRLLLVVPLWVALLGAVAFARRRGATGADLRLSGRPSDLLLGFPVGVVTQLVAVPLLYLPLWLLFDDLDVSGAARSLVDRAEGLDIVLLVIVVVFGAPIVEEIFYRGLVLGAFEARMGPRVALVASSVVFGAVHLQLLQFPALVLFGLVAGYLAQRSGRLLLSVAAHVGFNATTVTVLLATR
jgi:uncharacterized protein